MADNIRITKAQVRKALESRDPNPIRKLASRCEALGADALDLNAGPLTKDGKRRMCFFVSAAESATDLPLFIDTVNPRAMAAALETATRPVVLNGVSLEPAKLDHILPLAAEHGTDMVGFLLDEKSGVPKTREERFDLALRLVERVTGAGIPKERLIIDPVVPPLSWDDGLLRARECIGAIRMLPDLLGFPVRTVAGLSNLTTGSTSTNKKSLVEAAYISMLSRAGLTYAMIDMFSPLTVNVAKTSEILNKGEIFSWEQIPA